LARDRDVRNAIQAALVATGAFDAVYVWGLPEDYGSGASNMALAVIEPESSAQEDRWDAAPTGDLIVTSRATITLIFRAEDPQIRDEAAELLFDTAANALSGQSLAGFTVPGLTRFVSWKWQPPTAPERRITAVFSYQYIVPGWDEYDTTP
jgi:hypothetical protein